MKFEFPIHPLWVYAEEGYHDWEKLDEQPKVDKRKYSRFCAICGKGIRKADICNDCFKEHCPDGIYPDWVTELVKIESHIQRYIEPKEVANSDLSTDDFDFLDERNHDEADTGGKIPAAPASE